MAKIYLTTILFLSLMSSVCSAQEKSEKNSIGLGLKAGYNFSNVSGVSSIDASRTNGFNIGAFYAPGSGQKSGFGYRTEIVYSKQGYNFASGSTTGNVKLDYILLPQLTTFNITKFFQLQLGFQLAFLVNAQADSMVNGGVSNPYEQVMDYYNKFDYGFAGGFEIHPFAGLFVGARLNISLADASKEQVPGFSYPSFIPSISEDQLRNNVLQIFAGWKF